MHCPVLRLLEKYYKAFYVIRNAPFDNCIVSADDLNFQLRGVSGTEEVLIKIPGVNATDSLCKRWTKFTFPTPRSKQFSIYFLNDMENGCDIILRNYQDFEIWHRQFPSWNCGSKEANERCQWTSKGSFLWGGQYRLTAKNPGNYCKTNFEF